MSDAGNCAGNCDAGYLCFLLIIFKLPTCSCFIVMISDQLPLITIFDFLNLHRIFGPVCQGFSWLHQP